jgi:transcriptional regulator with XRE-family HTH domain
MARKKKAAEAAHPLRIAAAIRARRRRLGLTLSDLAGKSGLSSPFLSQVERNQATPSITSLMAIARALDTDIHYFINPPPFSEVEALLMTIPPGSVAPATAREGEGFYYVLGGRLTVTLGEETFVLGPGDSAHFDQRHPFQMGNAGKRVLRVLWVGTPTIF